MPDSSRTTSLTYTRVRLGWSLAALIDLLRRWSVYLTIGVLVLGSSPNGALAAMSGMTAWSVLPLMQAAQKPLWCAATVALAHSFAGAIVIWGLRPILWSRTWAEAEAALPIARRERHQGDLLVVVFGLTPLFCAYIVGTAIWAGRSPMWLHGAWPVAVGELMLSMALSIAWGMLVLQATRRPPRAALSTRARILRPVNRVSPILALVVLPLLRGPAHRTGRLLMITTSALLLVDAALWRWPQYTSWWLAGFAALAFASITRLNVVVTIDLTPLHDACGPLPLSASMLLRARRLVALLPQLVGQMMLLPAILSRPGSVRPFVLAAYMAAALVGATTQVVSASSAGRPRDVDPSTRASAWLFTLVLLVCLASEVIRDD